MSAIEIIAIIRQTIIITIIMIGFIMVPHHLLQLHGRHRPAALRFYVSSAADGCVPGC